MTSTPPETTPYTDDRLADLHQPPAGTAGPAPVVLLWHGSGPDERDVLRPLARAAADLGLLVVVPDWRPDRADGGRADLLASLAFARRNAGAHGGDPRRLVLAGWSLGAKEAVALATHPDTPAELRPAAVVGVAGRYDTPAATTGEPALTVLAARPSPVPVHLVHGAADEVVAAEHSRELRAAVPRARYLELPTDHAGVVMTVYSPEARRCVPATDPATLRAGRRTAAVLAEAAARS
ncbi:alpha/beta hydrolase [Kitasatospora sp. NPDC094028]